tara:strand:- start:167 stop:460 length:294 start_codon:yes stop_codon:yes gene_type:complete
VHKELLEDKLLVVETVETQLHLAKQLEAELVVVQMVETLDLVQHQQMHLYTLPLTVMETMAEPILETLELVEVEQVKLEKLDHQEMVTVVTVETAIK